MSDAAISMIDPSIDYDPAYFAIDYPNGDVPKNKDVCTDAIIRAYRKLGIDLQKEVHEDIPPHIGIVTNKKSKGGQRNLIVHNVGNGQVLQDCLLNTRL